MRSAPNGGDMWESGVGKKQLGIESFKYPQGKLTESKLCPVY